MKLAFTPEQDQFRGMVRSFVQDHSSEATLRSFGVPADTFDPAAWRRMADELGLLALDLPEEYGGYGSFVEVAIALEEMGRRLFVSPYLATVLASAAIRYSGDVDAMRALLPRIAAGETVATFAMAEQTGSWQPSDVALHAERARDTYLLTGTKAFVIDGMTADLIVVAGRTGRGVTLFVVDAHAEGLTRAPLPVVDQTRSQATLELRDTPATRLGADGGGHETLDRVLDLACAALAAEQVGGAQYVVELAVEHAKTRRQFGQPIGAFQAVKHRCADMLVRLESAKSAAYYAARCVAERPAELPVYASLAKSYCSEAYFQCTSDAVQILGGIGFAWEHPAHRYFKRAKSSELMFGDPIHHREQFAKRIGL